MFLASFHLLRTSLFCLTERQKVPLLFGIWSTSATCQSKQPEAGARLSVSLPQSLGLRSHMSSGLFRKAATSCTTLGSVVKMVDCELHPRVNVDLADLHFFLRTDVFGKSESQRLSTANATTLMALLQVLLLPQGRSWGNICGCQSCLIGLS